MGNWRQTSVLAVAVILSGVLVALAAIQPWRPDPAIHDLRLALVRLDAAISTGTTVVAFGPLVTELQAQKTLADSKLNSDQRAKVAVAMTDAIRADAIWNGTMEKQLPDSFYESLQTLGVLNVGRAQQLRTAEKSVNLTPISSPLWSYNQESRTRMLRELVSNTLTRIGGDVRAAGESLAAK